MPPITVRGFFENKFSVIERQACLGVLDIYAWLKKTI